MRTLKCLVLDMAASFRELVIWAAVAAVCFALMLVSLRIEVASEITSPDDGMTFNIAFSLGDYLMGYFSGCVPFLKSEGQHFSIPIAWFVFFLLLVGGTVRYPQDNLNGFGRHVLIATGNWWSWWIAKCIWVVVSALLFMIVACMVAVLFSVIRGSGPSLDVSPDLLLVTDFPWKESVGAPYSIGSVLVSAVVVAIAISLFQLCVSFLFDPIAGFGAAAVVLALSAFGAGSLGFACFSMAARSGSFVIGGYGITKALLVCGAVSIASIVIGGLAFDGRSRLGKGKIL